VILVAGDLAFKSLKSIFGFDYYHNPSFGYFKSPFSKGFIGDSFIIESCCCTLIISTIGVENLIHLVNRKMKMAAYFYGNHVEKNFCSIISQPK
jgi:hypothetical protein